MITQNDIQNYVTTAREEGFDDSKILSVTGISKEQLEQLKAE